MIAARVHGVLKSAFTGPPRSAGGPEAAGRFPGLQGADRRAGEHGGGRRFRHPGRPLLGAHRGFLRPADRDPVLRQRPLRRQPDRHAGRRRRADRPALPRRHQPPVHLVDAMQSEAEAKYRQTQQALQAHLDEVEKQLRSLRSGGGEADATAEAVITPEQRAAIDAARKDILRTRQATARRATGTEPRDFRSGNWLRIFNIVLVPAAADRAGDRSGPDPTCAAAPARGPRPDKEPLAMNQTRLLALVVAAMIAVAGGWYFGTSTQPAERRVDRQRQADVSRSDRETERRAAGSRSPARARRTAIELKNGVWGVADRGGYPVQDTKLRGLLTALTELRLMEPRTSDPAEFSRLGRGRPDERQRRHRRSAACAGCRRQADRGVIVGHRRMRTQGNVPEQVFVRRPDDNQSWLAEGGLQADADPQVWLDRDIMNISHTLIDQGHRHQERRRRSCSHATATNSK